VLACGRRWGKTTHGGELALETALEGWPVGWFAPTYKLLDDAWQTLRQYLRPWGSQVQYDNKDKVIRLPTGGQIEFWSTEPRQAGDDESEVARGRKYKRVVYDEAARAKRLKADWTKAIRPTLADLRGDAWFTSTPKGMGYFRQLYDRGKDPGYPEWASWQMPTATNPHIDPQEIIDAEADLPADAFSQEWLAEFLADASNPFGISHIRACCDPDWAAGGPVAVWGVDLAKSMDWTVGLGLDASGVCRAMQRWQDPWRVTTARLSAMLKDTPALIDSTGVGDPIVESLQHKCPLVEGYTYTSRSKQQLMEGLAVALQQREIVIPGGGVLQAELESFEYEYTRTGVRYTAPEGSHDDTVNALALAVRCLTTRPLAAVLDGGEGERSRSEAAWTDPYLDDDDELWTPI
jgi:hypothetical protein